MRTVLGPAYELREPDDDGLCCGAGGAYSVMQPELATAIRDRKVAALRAAGGMDPDVVSANPGCAMHLAAAGLVCGIPPSWWSRHSMADVADLVARLIAIEEELRDLAYDRLQAAAEEGDHSAAAEEKRVLQARRAVERAIGALGAAPEVDGS